MPLGSPIRIFGEHPYFPYPGYLHISRSLRSGVLSRQFFSDMASLGAAAYYFPVLYTQVIGGFPAPYRGYMFSAFCWTGTCQSQRTWLEECAPFKWGATRQEENLGWNVSRYQAQQTSTTDEVTLTLYKNTYLTSFNDVDLSFSFPANERKFDFKLLERKCFCLVINGTGDHMKAASQNILY